MSGFGDPAAVSSASDSLRRAAAVAEQARSLASRAQPDVWRGRAADAYLSANRETLPSATRLSDALDSASGTLGRYAAVQRELQADYERAQADLDRSVAALKRNPLDVSAGMTAVGAQVAGLGALGKLQQAAASAAGELRALSNEDGNDGAHPWWDPFGWFTEDRDPDDPDQRVSDNVLDDDSFTSDDVAQGQIGDCFALSSIVSLLNTDAGDDFIRDNVRWDPDKKGYWVTLYEDGKGEEVFVDHVYGKGARQKDWEWFIFSGDKPSIAALYESALQSKYGYSYLEGGLSWEAMEKITGREVTQQANEDYSGFSPRQVDSLRDVLNAGGQVTVSSPRSGEHPLTVEAPDGSTRQVELVTQHSYVATKIEADGSMWVRNPWGPGNSADGGGEFKVSADDVARLFWRSASTNISD